MPFAWPCVRWPLAALVLWLLLVFLFARAKPADYGGPGLCLFRDVTGVPCPTCGGTRMMMALGRGDVLAALQWNPLLLLVMTLSAAWLFIRIVLQRRIAMRCSVAQRRVLWIIAALLFVANWVWLIARAT